MKTCVLNTGELTIAIDQPCGISGCPLHDTIGPDDDPRTTLTPNEFLALQRRAATEPAPPPPINCVREGTRARRIKGEGWEMTAKMFPLQTSRNAPAGPVSIPWSVADRAYGEYVRRYGRSQSLEDLARRGGFSWCEMDEFHPGWRAEVTAVTTAIAATEQKIAAALENRAKVLRERPNDRMVWADDGDVADEVAGELEDQAAIIRKGT